MDKVAIGRVVLTNREHIIALELLDNGLVGMLPRYLYEVRSEQEHLDEIQDVKVTKDMLGLAGFRRALRAGVADRIQHVPDLGHGIIRRDARRQVLPRDVEGALAAERVGAVPHPAVLLPLADGSGFVQHRDGPAAQRPDGGGAGP